MDEDKPQHSVELVCRAWVEHDDVSDLVAYLTLDQGLVDLIRARVIQRRNLPSSTLAPEGGSTSSIEHWDYHCDIYEWPDHLLPVVEEMEDSHTWHKRPADFPTSDAGKVECATMVVSGVGSTVDVHWSFFYGDLRVQTVDLPRDLSVFGFEPEKMILENPTTGQYLDICTSHAPREDIETLGTTEAWVTYAYEEGVFVWAPSQDMESHEEAMSEIGVAESTLEIIRIAQRMGLHFVRFDCDGEHYDELPEFNW